MNELQNFINILYGNYPKHIPEGRITRFAASDNMRSKSCWVRNLGHLAFIGNWRGEEKVYCWRSEEHKRLLANMNQFQQEQYHEKLKLEEEKRRKEEEIEKSIYIGEVWQDVNEPAFKNSYIIKKQIDVYPDMKSHFGDVLVPMYKAIDNPKVIGIQLLLDKPFAKNPTDTPLTKRFNFNSQPKYAFYPIPNGHKLSDSDVIFIGEGYATCWSLNQGLSEYSDSMLFSVVVAFSGSNLKNVAEQFRHFYPNKIIIILADVGQIGWFYAQQACDNHKANFAIQLEREDSKDGEDFNDLWNMDKKLAVKMLSNQLYLKQDYSKFIDIG